jgi:hypothetical protein
MGAKFTVQAKAVEKIVNAAAAHGVQPQSLYDAVKLDPLDGRDAKGIS